ncbi:hypothetical protein P8452_35566 [Trifolium repens]|jgi:hypothetical protein|nr:hypothetical protein P8452_35566 [Trifolium repens]
MASSEQQQEEEYDKRTIPLKILVDKQRNKVVFVEAIKEFIDTLFSFLSLPLGTIIRLLATNNNNNEQQQPLSQFLGSIIPHDVWNNLVANKCCCIQRIHVNRCA